jgi:hypothetical protein
MPAKTLHKNTEHAYSKWPLAVLGFCSTENEVIAHQRAPTDYPLAMQAQAMKASTSRDELEGRRESVQPDEETKGDDASLETDEEDLDESHLEDADDGRWDAFILDDDGEPLPEYGDFWFPD